MHLRDALKPECVEAGSGVKTKSEALAEVVRVATRCPSLAGTDAAVLLSALQEREALGSTGIGKGVAIPHCRLPGVKEFVVGLITVPGAVAFDAIDGRPVKVLAFIVAPAAMTEGHVVLLSQISQLLVGPGAVEQWAAVGDSDGLFRKVMAELGSADADTKPNWPASLFQIIFADEEVFHDVLPILSAVPGCQAVVSDVSPSGAFLRHMPLFASFWTETTSTELKLLTAVVPKAMTNEVIRRIDQATGGIAGRHDVLLVVQDLFFCSGSLS